MKTISYTILFLTLFSCISSPKKFKYSELKGIDSILLGSIIRNKSPYNYNLKEIFEMHGGEYKDTIRMKIDKKGNLAITYKDKLKNEQLKTFRGRFRKKYYQIYLHNQTIPFPPILFFRDVNRLRISITKDSTLVINQYFDHQVMILLNMGGSGGKNQKDYKKEKIN